jgi:hypothetical protein
MGRRPNGSGKIDRKIRRRRDTITSAQRKLREHQTSQFQDAVAEEKKRISFKIS